MAIKSKIKELEDLRKVDGNIDREGLKPLTPEEQEAADLAQASANASEELDERATAESDLIITARCSVFHGKNNLRRQCNKPATHKVTRTNGRGIELTCEEHIGPAMTWESFTEIEQ